MPYIFNRRLCGKEIIHRKIYVYIYIYYHGLTPNIFIIKSLLIMEIRQGQWKLLHELRPITMQDLIDYPRLVFNC